MTNQTLLSVVQPSLQALSGNHPEFDYDGAQTTTVRYAVVKNERRIQNALEDYQETLSDLADQHDVKLEDGIPNDDDFQDDFQELLEQDSGFEPYTISESDLKQEPDMPFEIIALADEWLVSNR